MIEAAIAFCIDVFLFMLFLIPNPEWFTTISPTTYPVLDLMVVGNELPSEDL
ncbi:MAG TPA: hypothetical protein VFR94_26345 [Nitrososphaeraceae archaeon]|nr:hypothetical protein [Nitrososphaeraceae archaeon]